MYGLTKYGFIIKRGNVILQNIKDILIAKFPGINLSDDSMNLALVGIFAEELAAMWEVANGTYNSQYPQSAEGQQLDNICEINAITRLGETASKAVITTKGTEGTVIPNTFIAQKQNTTIQFRATESITITKDLTNKMLLEVITPIDITDYIIIINNHTVIINSGIGATPLTIASQMHDEINTLTDLLKVSAELPIVLDGTFTILSNNLKVAFVAIPDAKFTINDFWTPFNSECMQIGSIAALSGSINEIITPVAGLDSIINFLDAEEGREIETDTELRIRRFENVRIIGAATVEAIRARILNDVENVDQCKVYENEEDYTDTEGRPPHSVEALVLGGSDQDIAKELWLVKAGGIKTFGSTAIVIYDSMDNPHTMNFSRPVEVNIWVRLTLVTDGSFPPNGEQQITNGILELATQSFDIGDDVLIQKLYCPIYQVAGVISVLVEISGVTAPVYDTVNIPIDEREVAVFDSSRIIYL